MDKLESKSDSLSYTSNISPPLYQSETHQTLGRNYTIPTPESSPSSCTSDVFHPSLQLGSVPMGLEGVRYTLPTPDVSPLDGQVRPLEYPNYHISPQDRFNFESAPLPGIHSFIHSFIHPSFHPSCIHHFSIHSMINSSKNSDQSPSPTLFLKFCSIPNIECVERYYLNVKFLYFSSSTPSS